MDVLGCGVFEVDAIYLPADLQIVRHARLGDDHRGFESRRAFQVARIAGLPHQTSARRMDRPFHIHRRKTLLHLEQTRTTCNPIGFERRRDGQADRLVGAALIRHDKMRGQRIEPKRRALRRSVEGFEVYGDICPPPISSRHTRRHDLHPLRPHGAASTHSAHHIPRATYHASHTTIPDNRTYVRFPRVSQNHRATSPPRIADPEHPVTGVAWMSDD